MVRLMQAIRAGPIWREFALPDGAPVPMSQYSLMFAVPPAMTLSAIAPTFAKALASPFQR